MQSDFWITQLAVVFFEFITAAMWATWAQDNHILPSAISQQCCIAALHPIHGYSIRSISFDCNWPIGNDKKTCNDIAVTTVANLNYLIA